ncbi:hypothetical protein ACFFRR_006435 [Megaselia abdita]
MTDELQCYICETTDPPLLAFPFGTLLFKWLKIIKIPVSEYNLDMRLCSLHFQEEYLKDSRTSLTENAIPTLFLGPGGTMTHGARNYRIDCSIPGCTTTGSSKIKMFNFPMDERRKAWKEATGLKWGRRTLQACVLHFHTMYVNNDKLDPCAVPMFGVHPTQSHLVKEIQKITDNPNEAVTMGLDDRNPNRTRYCCSIPGCDTDNFANFRMFGFPKDERRTIWLDAVGLGSSKRSRLWACVLHFDAKRVNNTRLLRDAVPIPGVHPSQKRRLGREKHFVEEIEDSNDVIEIIEEPEEEENPKLVYRKCSVPGCNTNSQSNLRIFSFPSDERDKIWRESVGKAQSKRKRLFACILHFDQNQVNYTRLDRNAVPILGVHPSQVHWLEPITSDSNLNTQESQDNSLNSMPISIDLDSEDSDVEEIHEIDSRDSLENSSTQTVINNLGITEGFLPGTRTIVRIIEKPN